MRARSKPPPGLPLLEIWGEKMGVRDSSSLGRRHPAFPDVLHGVGREHRRPDYINPCGHTRSNDNHISARTGYKGDNTDRHYSKRHARDLTDNPRANRYEQQHGDSPWGWLHEDAQRGCSRGAHLLVGSCPRQTSGSGDRGPLALDRVDAPSCPGRGAPARGLRVEHTPMFPGQTIPTWRPGVVYPHLPPRRATPTWGLRVEHTPMSPVQASFGYQHVFGYPSLPLGWASPPWGRDPGYQAGNPGGPTEARWGIAQGFKTHRLGEPSG
ncbi:hypothetical protein D1007_33861 [Hordeum vulgare]|nr:hypothetical protein D1007_33861 [Hordeum vulgare]